MKKNLLLDANKIENIIKRLSCEIIEKNNNLKNICIIGIKSRGDIIANRIVKKILEIKGEKIESGYIDVTFYRDDFLSNLGSHKIGPSKVNIEMSKYHIILIDDVLYTGRTIKAAMDEIFSYGRPLSIQLAVLIDRGNRQLPIKANYIGKNIPSSNAEQVHVYVEEFDKKDEVFLVEHR
tara:strand:+ start:125 stop:661 length:537 start_codon:yes stop_codon:yes gene_type:complete